ncbi:MAG: hypothetical protein IPI46_01245 [Bacteroidetes bacterium]|nr:hypothetical protein [Bacteroidota bacterium]
MPGVQVASCPTLSIAQGALDNLVNSASFTGGCNATLHVSGDVLPSLCGTDNIITVEFKVTSDCEADVIINRTFEILDPTARTFTCPTSSNEPACQTQAAIDLAYDNWVSSFTTADVTGGCNTVVTNNAPSAAPSACGGSQTVIWTVHDDCNANATCSATFTVAPNTAPTATGSIATSNVSGCDALAAPAAVTDLAGLTGLGLTIGDDCPTTELVVSHNDVPSGSCPLVITRTYTLTDACGAIATAVHTINIIHTEVPVVPADVNSTVQCLADATAPTAPIVLDQCGNAISPVGPSLATWNVQNFSNAILTGPTAAPNTWYTDRYAPAGFVAPFVMGGDNVLKVSINAADGSSTRPPAYWFIFIIHKVVNLI